MSHESRIQMSPVADKASSGKCIYRATLAANGWPCCDKWHSTPEVALRCLRKKMPAR